MYTLPGNGKTSQSGKSASESLHCCRNNHRLASRPHSQNRLQVEELSFRENKLFRGLPRHVLDEIAPTLRAFEPDEVIFREGDPAECLFLLASGTVRISKRGRGGRQETLAFFEAGDFFGEMGLYGQTTRSARATAVSSVTVGCLDKEPFERLLAASPAEVVTNLLTENVARLRDTDARLIREMLEAERLSLIGSMLSTIIHDIRSPLSIVRGAADLLAEGPGPEKRAKYTGMLRRSVDRIADMVQELLDYSRGTTKLRLERVPPRELVQELADEVFAGIPSDIILDIRIGYDEPITMDRSRFFRVLQNIIKNAVEAMPDGGNLSLVLSADGPNARFEVSDEGRGIPRDLLPQIFEPFVTYGKSGGTGLGMAIAKSVVEAHQGSIRVESEEGKGTTFTIEIPLVGLEGVVAGAS